MKHIAKTMIAALLLAVVGGCSGGMEIQTDFDKETDFRGYSTWDWVPEPAQETGDPGVDDPIVRTRIQNAVEEELTKRGYLRSTDTPDFLVNYHTAMKDELDVVEVTDYYDRMPYTEFEKDVTYTYTWHKGTLVLDFIDSASNKLVWRGIARAEVNLNDSPENKKKRIAKAVERMLREFPPK
ncbi:MAG: DUF4136 domain-containing protein [Candidatus Latescibacterota bacterium]|nr:MAG: DUF4136 domain-containing protein [Candidatus Latescibacterota bacterium]